MASNREIAWWFSYMVAGAVMAVGDNPDLARILGFICVTTGAWNFMSSLMSVLRPTQVVEEKEPQ